MPEQYPRRPSVADPRRHDHDHVSGLERLTKWHYRLTLPNTYLTLTEICQRVEASLAMNSKPADEQGKYHLNHADSPDRFVTPGFVERGSSFLTR